MSLWGLEVQVSDVLLLALVLITLLSYRREGELRDLQRDLLKTQTKLSARTLEKAKKAALGASFITAGSTRYRLRVFNKGEVVARQVQLYFPEGNEVVPEQEIKSRFPHRELEPHGKVDFPVYRTLHSKNSFAIHLSWTNEDGTPDETTVYPTL